jgi:hypothetical protein
LKKKMQDQDCYVVTPLPSFPAFTPLPSFPTSTTDSTSTTTTSADEQRNQSRFDQLKSRLCQEQLLVVIDQAGLKKLPVPRQLVEKDSPTVIGALLHSDADIFADQMPVAACSSSSELSAKTPVELPLSSLHGLSEEKLLLYLDLLTLAPDPQQRPYQKVGSLRACTKSGLRSSPSVARRSSASFSPSFGCPNEKTHRRRGAPPRTCEIVSPTFPARNASSFGSSIS